ncbi:immunity 22 family protein [Bacillus paramycoides]|uniref:Immunity 22 family protein n=1 Tax=Bacillus paramycoides TaxID=2026194 RepID=A0ABU6N4N8_9BACI|nr:immunity 22 family protein [Bacillus paramycoides]MED0987874.1 immunity 22 family protein [Bacillus paramycoides]MED1093786.1 immunity 22 family protein [Bacillus paramycoides]MED1106186.1 immunity 22 family protein [Bacillus paramycoides]MED1569069.1 immunity 22 family protein [Bacillus paramycoides]
MEVHGMVSIWLGNMKTQDQLDAYMDVTYDEEGDSIPAKFFIDFNIDMIDVDDDFIEKEVLEETSDDISVLLAGCSYDDEILSRIKEGVKLGKPYNSIVLIYNFQYDNSVSDFEDFDFLTATSYL